MHQIGVPLYTESGLVNHAFFRIDTFEKRSHFYSLEINPKRGPGQMKNYILVLDGDQKQCHQLCTLLETRQFRAKPLYSISNLKECLSEGDCLSVFIDIDTISVDNRTIRDLTIRFPGIYFFGLSERPFHPELHDAICYHIYACINKPVDPEELFYWLRSINVNETKFSKPTTN